MEYRVVRTVSYALINVDLCAVEHPEYFTNIVELGGASAESVAGRANPQDYNRWADNRHMLGCTWVDSPE
jgi:hypothetical protein